MNATHAHGIPDDAPHPSKVTSLPVWESATNALHEHAWSGEPARADEGTVLIRFETEIRTAEWMPEIPVDERFTVEGRREFEVAYRCKRFGGEVRGEVVEVVAVYEWRVEL